MKDGVIDESTTATGLQEAKRKLEYMALSRSEKLAYDEHLNAVMMQNDVISTNRMEAMAEGLEKGRVEGLEKGRAEQARAIARSLKAAGMDDEFITVHTGLSLAEIVGMD